MEAFESFWREADRRYSNQLVPKIRKAVVTAAASPFSYSVQLPGETIDRSGVSRVSAVTPRVGDEVRLGIVGDQPMILDVIGRGRLKLTTQTSVNASTGSATYIVSGVGTDTITTDLVAGQVVSVIIGAKMAHTLDTGHAAVLSFRVTGASTYGPLDDDGCEQDNIGGVTCERTTIYTADNTGSHVFTLMYKAINGATANFFQRRLSIVE